MTGRWQDTKVVAAGYAGTPRSAAAIGPAAKSLRRMLSGARLLLLAPVPVFEALPAPIAACFDARIDYPPDADAERLRAAVDALAVETADAAVVFTETGWSAHVPAYLAYLAGVPRRGGITAEFGGALLTDPVRPPATLDAEERHLLLLEALGIIDRNMTTARSARTPAGTTGHAMTTPS